MQKVSQHIRPFFTRRFLLVSLFCLSLLAGLLLRVPGASAQSITPRSQGSVGVSQAYYNAQSYTYLSSFDISVVRTPPLPAGTYLVSATELAAVDTNDDVYCYIQSVRGTYGTASYGAYGPASSYQWATFSVNDSLTVSAGDQIALNCSDYNADSYTYSYNATITAIPYTIAGSNANALTKVHGNKPTHLPRLHH